MRMRRIKNYFFGNAQDSLTKFLKVHDPDEVERLLSELLSLTKLHILKSRCENYSYGYTKLLVDDEGRSKISFFDHPFISSYRTTLMLNYKTTYFFNHRVRFSCIEPYSLSLSEIKELVSFCENNNLDCDIDGNSIHYPGRCIRVLFRKKGEN